MKKLTESEQENLARVRRETVEPTWIQHDSKVMPIVVFEEEERRQKRATSRSSGNPDPGDAPITNYLDEHPDTCTEVAEPYGFPDCMPWTIYNGKILFRLSSYDYTRSRANEACQAMGGWLSIAFTEQDMQDIRDFLEFEAIGNLILEKWRHSCILGFNL